MDTITRFGKGVVLVFPSQIHFEYQTTFIDELSHVS
jgi:hypothetical protein